MSTASRLPLEPRVWLAALGPYGKCRLRVVCRLDLVLAFCQSRRLGMHVVGGLCRVTHNQLSFEFVAPGCRVRLPFAILHVLCLMVASERIPFALLEDGTSGWLRPDQPTLT